MTRQILLLSLLFLSFSSSGQILSGTILDASSGEVIIGASIIELKTQKGVLTNSQGRFEIALQDYPSRIVLSYVGYRRDTLEVLEAKRGIRLHMSSNTNLRQVDIIGKETLRDNINPLVVEKVTVDELRKAACCNLAETFDNSASVDVQYSDAITGSQKIQMLGLDGVHSQIMLENFPILRGLTANAGLETVPGPWMESIFITKGLGSVVNGFEALTGQINVEYLKPFKTEENIFFEIFANEMGRSDVSHYHTINLGDKWKVMNMVNARFQPFKNDRNEDNFTDMPFGNMFNAFTRFRRQGLNHNGQYGLRFSQHDLEGGQLTSRLGTGLIPYRVKSDHRTFAAFSKNAFFFKNSTSQSIGWMIDYQLLERSQRHFHNVYQGKQNTLYTNLIYQNDKLSQTTSLRAGLSLRSENIEEELDSIRLSRTETVPGVFAEIKYEPGVRFNLLLGLRADKNNLFGWWITPRIHAKWNYHERGSFRVSAGQARRTPFIISENLNWLLSSRELNITKNLRAENALAFSGSITQGLRLLNKEVSFILDANYTYFRERLLSNLEVPDRLVIDYIGEGSKVLSVQAESEIEFNKHWLLKLAYRRTFNQALYFPEENIEKIDLLIPQQVFLANLAYASAYDKWRLSTTMQYVGRKRLAASSDTPNEDLIKDVWSDPFVMWQAQISRKFKRSELFVGVNNILNVKQREAIRNGHDPYGTNFDAAMIWGPLAGRTAYAGFRFRI